MTYCWCEKAGAGTDPDLCRFGGVGSADGIGRAVPEVASWEWICAERSCSAAALILEFMPGSNVHFPKYMIWLISLAPLSAEGIAGPGVSVVFPIGYKSSSGACCS